VSGKDQKSWPDFCTDFFWDFFAMELANSKLSRIESGGLSALQTYISPEPFCGTSPKHLNMSSVLNLFHKAKLGECEYQPNCPKKSCSNINDGEPVCTPPIENMLSQVLVRICLITKFERVFDRSRIPRATHT